ncbi:MAG: UvrD-helicase domain-containing protein, partial [Synergistota bacterium]|nr:UvrD-helicase domain-containing protein [Synergistota bacterium]
MTDDTLLRRLKEHISSNGLLLPAQERAVFSDAPVTLVGAGAGTGKTHTLSWRFIRALIRADVRPRDILALTFTEKAAEEMRARIEALFSELRPILDPNGERLSGVASELQEARISTIHSFALGIVREQALFLPSGLGARPVTPPEEELFVARATRALDSLDTAWFDRALPPGRGAARWLGGDLDVLADVVNEYGPGVIVSFSLALSDLLESRGESPDSLSARAEDGGYFDEVARRIRSICLKEAREVASVWTGLLASLPAKLEGKSGFNERVDVLRSRWAGALPPATDDGSLDFALEIFNEVLGDLTGASGSKTGKRMQEHLCRTLKDFRDSYPSLKKGLGFLASPPSETEMRLRSLLLRTAAMIWEAGREYRARRGLLSYDDMIRLAAELSSRDDRVRSFKEIMVDEYQDTNPLQDKLIESAAAEGCRRFLVGDPKQSIYRFRHADPAIFGAKTANPSEGAVYIPLQTSFRARPSLLDEVNRLFGRLWKERIAEDMPTPYEPLLFPDDPEAGRVREADALPPVNHIFLRMRGGERISEARIRVATALGEKLLELHGGLVWDKGREEMRPAEWRDMTILVPTRASFAALEETLHPLFGIPTAFERGKQFFDRGETGDLANAMRALVFPEDRAATLGFLLSPFSGLGANEAARLLAPGAPSLEESHPEIASRLEELRTVARYEGLFGALVVLLRDQSFLARYPLWRRKSALANLWRGLDLVREYETVFGNDPGGCCSYLARMAGGGGSVEETPPLGDEEDVVRVMTVHSAKGLEFPITVVMDLDNRPGGGGGRTSLVPSAVVGAGFSSLPEAWEAGDKSNTAGVARFLEEASEQEEWQRLFYVAFTRARDCLVLCSTCGEEEGEPTPKPGSWLFLIEPTVPEDSTDIRPERKRAKPPEDEAAGRLVVPPPMDPALVEMMSATSYSLFRYCPAAWRMKHRQGMELTWEMPSDEEPGGADLGSLAHWILSRWDLRS